MKRNWIGGVLTSVTLSAAGLLMVIPAQAVAEAPVRQGGLETRAVAVSYGDLDLSREEGVRLLYKRLQLAAKRVCGSYDLRQIGDRRDWERCYDTALTNAVVQAGNERLAVLHESGDRHGQRVIPRIAVVPDGR